jgi:hypothetical protein
LVENDGTPENSERLVALKNIFAKVCMYLWWARGQRRRVGYEWGCVFVCVVCGLVETFVLMRVCIW